MHKIGMLYDMIWVYGPPDFYDPLSGLEVPAKVRAKMKFVGFLQRGLSRNEEPDHRPKGDYMLVTTGGGGDGAELIHSVIHAYQQDPDLDHRALVVLGPYMPAKKRRKLMRKAASIPFIEMIEFDNRMEELIAGAKAVVAMGGYNTYCEILSFDKPALIVPRVAPRQEQLIRASRAAELGLIEMLLPEEADDAAALRGGAEGPARSRSAVEEQPGPQAARPAAIFPRSWNRGWTSAPARIFRWSRASRTAHDAGGPVSSMRSILVEKVSALACAGGQRQRAGSGKFERQVRQHEGAGRQHRRQARAELGAHRGIVGFVYEPRSACARITRPPKRVAAAASRSPMSPSSRRSSGGMQSSKQSISRSRT